jgi:beta-lactamase regulating signal transducer with metallopeptidase domain
LGSGPKESRIRTSAWELALVGVLALPALYLLVAMTLLVRFGQNLRSLRRMAERSQLISDTQRRTLAHEIWLKSGAFLKPRLAASDEISAPVTFDAGDVWILLPSSWRGWNEAKLAAVLTHEMAHIERGDSASFQLAAFTTCLFWFHPLAWFVRRRLAALAEEACDEVAVASAATPEQYANFLIDFAGDVRRRRGRLIAQAMGAARGTRLQRRIERLFRNGRRRQRGQKWLAALALAVFVPALYLTAAARFDEPLARSTIVWPRWEQIVGLSAADAATIESAVQANPEDLASRMELLVYYGYHEQDQPFTAQLLWFIQHHPDVATLSMAQGSFRGRDPLSESSAEQIRVAWEDAVTRHADSPAVLVNAALFLERTDPERGLQLLRQAQSLDAGARDQPEREISTIYTAAELEAISPGVQLNNLHMSYETAVKLRAQLEASGDPALLAAAGRTMVEFNVPPRASEEQNSRGLELIRQAIALDPGNAKWTEALEEALTEPQRRLAFERLRTEPPQRGLVHIGPSVAEANLVSKVDPVYPPLALTARIQGIVEFTVTVAPDGKVEALELVRGHPLLVNAAKEAVLKWIYRPVTIDGKAIPFITQVLVPFRRTE